MDPVHVDACSAGKREKRGSHSPFTMSNSDWLLQSKSPIRELPIMSSLIPLTEQGAERTKPSDPHIQNTVSCLCVFAFACVCVCAHV